MKNTSKIAHPLFILSLFLLILNDWCFKSTFHNDITGKLSDFAGLFAFPFFICLIFSINRKLVHCLTGILFIIWNSEFSQTVIDYLNNYGLPLSRTVDITDNIALISIFISYKCLDHQLKYQLKALFQKVLIVISSLAFVATTIPPQEKRKFVNINKEYHFEFSKRELVSRLNMVQLEEIRRLNKLSGEIDFDSETSVFHYSGRTDTLALLLDNDQITEHDTINLRSSYAEIVLTGNRSNSKLVLLSVYKIAPKFKDKDYANKAIKQFEKQVVGKIKKNR